MPSATTDRVTVVREAFENAEDVSGVSDHRFNNADFRAVVYPTNPCEGIGFDRLREETGVDFDVSGISFTDNGAVAASIRVPE